MVTNDDILTEIEQLGKKIDKKIDDNTKEMNQFYTAFAREILQLKINLNILEREVRSKD